MISRKMWENVFTVTSRKLWRGRRAAVRLNDASGAVSMAPLFNAIARALNIAQVFLYVDDTFYALPLEEQSTHNYFVSGFEFDISENIGVGLTYKNGEPSPGSRASKRSAACCL
jgi:hypothetical protein